MPKLKKKLLLISEPRRNNIHRHDWFSGLDNHLSKAQLKMLWIGYDAAKGVLWKEFFTARPYIYITMFIGGIS